MNRYERFTQAVESRLRPSFVRQPYQPGDEVLVGTHEAERMYGASAREVNDQLRLCRGASRYGFAISRKERKG